MLYLGDDKEAWDAADLQILKAKNDAFIESQKGMLELTKMILRGTFIINGAVAVLAAKDPLLYTAMLYSPRARWRPFVLLW